MVRYIDLDASERRGNNGELRARTAEERRTPRWNVTFVTFEIPWPTILHNVPTISLSPRRTDHRKNFAMREDDRKAGVKVCDNETESNSQVLCQRNVNAHVAARGFINVTRSLSGSRSVRVDDRSCCWQNCGLSRRMLWAYLFRDRGHARTETRWITGIVPD